MNMKADIGLIGLAVMGQNLVLNMNDRGYKVAVYNRTSSKTDTFIATAAKGRNNIYPAHNIEDFIALLARPRKIMLMVKAGEVVDNFINQLLPHLEEGDIIIDGGNSNYLDSNHRSRELEKKGILFIGAGVSGGEEGARHGPSIMPGGNILAWESLKPIFQDIAAKTEDGSPCCDWVGQDGAGHFVKMVHNGIEYGDMQLISEVYHLMKEHLGLSAHEMQEAFRNYMDGELNSYLVEIAGNILGFMDDDGSPMLEKILDSAGQKGTGKWTAIQALEFGSPVTLIGEAVFARFLSSLIDERQKAAGILKSSATSTFTGDKKAFIGDLGQAMLASKIISYAQGFMLMREASKEYNWQLNYGGIALMWRSGCIIRSVFLDRIKAAFDRDSNLENILLDPWFKAIIQEGEAAWRRVVSTAALVGIPLPAMSSALAFFDGYRSARLPANMLQALRDYFGAHSYERIDFPRGQFFHTNWTGSGGSTISGQYEL